MSKYDDLVRKLKEIFQIDKPELDFGVYRILNARSSEIVDYLENRLKAKVAQSLAQAGSANSEHIKHELTEAEKNAASLGVSPDAVPKVLELRQKLADYGSNSADHENAVFTHLLTFFSRYYDSGDFISQRRYKGDTYAIPYAGEEVLLHWANKDQYYTKSGENFSNYAFKLDDGRTVRFRLVTADTAKDNRKDNDKERRFALIAEHTRTLLDEEGDEYEETLLPITEEVNAEGNAELVIRFEYKAFAKGTKQDDLTKHAIAVVLGNETVKARWLDIAQREPTEKNPQRTLLEKCLTSYTNKNTADYFIHKDLGSFLKRELDFYIKNEVMQLDDVQDANSFADIEKNLRMIQTLRSIALDLITFLAQLEDFQKKLWLKKKFVVSTNYCITLDRIDQALYPTIASNQAQWAQWQQLGMLQDNIPTGDAAIFHLKAFPYLMVDTALFDVEFKFSLLARLEKVDESLNGLLINGDNFQSLKLIQKKYWEAVKTIYIDPPYNTSASEITYKNGYKHSSWLSLISDRINLSRNLMNDASIISIAIDDAEFSRIHMQLMDLFGEDNHLSTVAIRAKPQGRAMASGFSPNHEYAEFFSKGINATVGRLPRDEDKLARYAEKDDKGIYAWSNLRGTGANSFRADRPKLFYPIFINQQNKISIPELIWDELQNTWIYDDSFVSEYTKVYPIDENGDERVWTLGWERARTDLIEDLEAKEYQGNIQIYRKYRPNQEGALPGTWWADPKYSASENGTKLIKALFGDSSVFSYPKSIFTVEDCLRACNTAKNDVVLDYFAGSATTGHAVINLNRLDQGNRKYILVEQGEYFDTVTKPRIQKVVYSADWKDGKATAPETGISQAFTVLKIELNRTQAQQDLLNQLPAQAREDYLMRYMLDIESKDSLLSVSHFNKPFDYKLKVAVDSAGAYEEKPVDLIETFNYLIGLRVLHVDYQLAQGFAAITGHLPTGEKALVLWRDTEKVDYEALNKLCDKLAINPADKEYDVVYINGDHNIPTVLTNLEAEGGVTKTLKIRQIEPEFLSRMFSVEDV